MRSSRRSLRPLPRLITVLGLLAVSSGATSVSCSFGSSTDNDQADFATELSIRDAGGTTRDSFARGELIQLVLSVHNRRDRPATLEFPSTRTFDFLVVRAGTRDIAWQRSAGGAAPSPTVTTLAFAANESRSFTTTWNQVDDDGLQAPSGTYEARGVLVFPGFEVDPLRPHPLGSALERFVIR